MLTKIASAVHRRSNLEDPNTPLTGKNILASLFGRWRSNSGLNIGVNEALSYSPVWSAVQQITGEISRLPWRPYKQLERGREKLPSSHPVSRLLKYPDLDNGISINIWLTRLVGHALLHGNGYAVIHRLGTDKAPVRLEWVHSAKVVPHYERGKVWYQVTWNEFEDGQRDQMVQPVPSYNMFHLQGLTLSSLGGLSLVAYARNCFGRQLSAEVYGDDFFNNSAVPQGFFSHPGKPTEAAQKNFVEGMRDYIGGAGKRHRTVMLPEGMTWHNIGISPKDAMLVDLMKWGPEDVARFFSIPAHKLGSDKRTGYNTTEQEQAAFYNETLGRWTSRLCWESLKLFDRESELDSHYTAFDIDRLIRANTKERYEAHAIAVQWGFKTRNEVRDDEDLNPLDGLDEVLTPTNMAAGPDPTEGQDDELQPPTPDDPPPPNDEDDTQDDADDDDDGRAARLLLAQRDVVLDKLHLMSQRLFKAAEPAAKKPQMFLSWINNLEGHYGSMVRTALQPSARLIAAKWDLEETDVLANLCTDLFSRARDVLLRAAEVQADNLASSVADAKTGLDTACQEIATRWITKKGT